MSRVNTERLFTSRNVNIRKMCTVNGKVILLINSKAEVKITNKNRLNIAKVSETVVA